MTTLERVSVGGLIGIVLGCPLYLPWVLARLGIYKRWYVARFIPPFSWSRAVYFFPASAFFLSIPCIALLPVEGNTRSNISVFIAFAGFALAPIIAIWTPRWLKPDWQRYLEDNYNQTEIRTFIPIWREMEKQEWSAYLDSEEGIDELVAITREKLGS
jgi:hypothetical protein